MLMMLTLMLIFSHMRHGKVRPEYILQDFLRHERLPLYRDRDSVVVVDRDLLKL